MDAIAQFIIDTLVGKFQVSAGPAHPGATFGSLEVDSLVLIELAVILQARYSVVIADGELTGEHTIAGTAELVGSKVAA